jgi:hypothetical protein
MSELRNGNLPGLSKEKELCDLRRSARSSCGMKPIMPDPSPCWLEMNSKVSAAC